MARPRAENPRVKITNIRLTEEERADFENAAAAQGCKNISEYIRFLHAAFSKAPEGKVDGQDVNPRDYPENLLRLFHRTDLGEIFWGDSRSYLFNKAAPESVDLIMTSPPFGLVRKKKYGNEDAEQYCEWFRPFAEGFRRVLKGTGSLVIDIGGAMGAGATNPEPLSFQAPRHARRRIRLPPLPRALLVESLGNSLLLPNGLMSAASV